ncbi:unnamed protein product, partial [Rotaria sp. Silwood2]
MNERHTFDSAHPQSTSHLIIKRLLPVVPVLIGPQIPRREREETHERYSRALLTLFVPWRSVQDLCALSETWLEALEARRLLISSNSLKIIENIQLLHECKHDRDEHVHQVLLEAQDDNSIDPILMPNYYQGDENADEDDPEQLLQMLSIVNETTTNAYSGLTGTHEQRYVHDALQAIDNTDRFALLNDSRHIWDQNNYGTIHDINTFVVAHAHHSVMIKGWKRDIEGRRDEARNYLISGENTLEVRDDETQIEVVTTEIPTSPIKTRATRVPPVTTTNAILFPTKQDIIRQFTLSTQQKYAFIIITSHLDGENHACTDTIDHQLLMCIPGCGGTGKSQLIRAITKYFQVTKRDKMLRKLAPTSIAAAEIDGLTIHSFLGESRKNSKKKQTRTFRPGDTKLENEWRHVKYLIIDEMSMVGLSLLARLNRIVKTAKHAPILVFRNTLRTQINNRAVLNKTTEMGLTPIVCIAQDYIQGKPVDDLRLRKAILELPDNKTEHLPGYLPLVPGMPVLLTENIAAERGLSNGTRGIFRQLVYDESEE